MNSQTARRPEQKRRPARSKKSYVRQTAHVEARRDGKPLIFGWGGHLSRNEKIRIQQRAIWGAAALAALLIIVVLGGFWVKINILDPNRTITTVNGQTVTANDYRKLIALKTQFELNKIYGPKGLIAQRDALKKQLDAQQTKVNDQTKKIDDLNKKIKALPAGPSADRTSLEGQVKTSQSDMATAQKALDDVGAKYGEMTQGTIPLEQQTFTQPQYGNDTAQWLQTDVLIQQWLPSQPQQIRELIDPNTDTVNNALKDFKANIPKTSSYDKFLSDNHLNDTDVLTMMAVKLRHDHMLDYLSIQVKSPLYQVHVREMVIDTQAHAQKVLDELKKGGDFGKLASKNSSAQDSAKQGGDLGWLATGEYANKGANQSGTIDNWIFDPSRKLDQISPIIFESGTYHILQITGIDPSRDLDADRLKTLQTNAIDIWRARQASLPGNKLTPPDQTLMFDPTLMPPGLPASAPAQQQQQQPGLPTG